MVKIVKGDDRLLKRIMLFKRILHPVGQGAFYTEQILDENGNSLFNVVYDCGSFTREPNLVEYEIRNTFDKKDHIDLLFISHFDEDHVNKLTALLNHTTIDKDTRVILPFRHPFLLMVMAESYPSLSGFMAQVFALGTQVIGMDEESEKNILSDPIDFENLRGGTILSGKQVIRYKKDKNPLWFFYPFMLDNHGSLQNDFISKAQVVADLNDPNDIILKRKELRDIYKTIGKTKGGVTKINVNSLLMLSFPVANLCFNTSIWHYVNICCGLAPTCLYTGDVNLKGNDYISAKKKSTEMLGMFSKGTKVFFMQVPHHGSRKCFPKEMADSSDNFFRVAFVNCNPFHSRQVFDNSIIGDFTRSGKPLLLVTESYHSRVEIVVEFIKINEEN